MLTLASKNEINLDSVLRSQMIKLDQNKDRTDYQKEKEMLGLLENLDSLTYQKTRIEQIGDQNGQIVKEFNGSRTQQTSQVYMSSLKAKISLLSKQMLQTPIE